MRYLITGACGFIGSNLVERLLTEGHRVIGVDNLITGRIENIEEFLNTSNFTFMNHDVIEPIDIEEELDWIVHLASPASPPKYLKYPVETMRVNSEGTLHLLELARRKGAKFLFSSTSEVYGNPLVHPQTESYWGNVNPIGPRSVYDESKRYAEALIAAYRRKYGLSVRIVRIFNTYGPKMDPNDGRVVSNFITQALKNEPITIYGDGKQTRSFQYIDDLIEGILRLMEVEYHEPVNIGNPEEYTIRDLAEMIIKLTDSKSKVEYLPLPEDDPERRKPDISCAKRILGWEPKTAVKEGLLKTIDYFRKLI
ncbi:UDP-glucuronic acid decarboxylase family protein [Caldicellulosiruptor morganii]|uniref:SDR family oxidoreductase n=1 Tax=Caldicellulosiruptor morganii TaxID=1387555 RepID=A0ABY7BLG1_9FIRM|nr:UDP-glucuronic acid decarboxylase family protein [Caldicellulosiruptor morganii]WAM33649.1 SDR family oxidoreductase [Caldicellulosiruptor morganii]